MLKAIVVEDEFHARKHLIKLIEETETDIEVTADFDTVSQTAAYLLNHEPDLIFLDIHLADGLAFNLFSQIREHQPVIFTTAFDQYALRAFKVNAVDYLLKPIDPTDLKRAIKKYVDIHLEGKVLPGIPSNTLRELSQEFSPKYKRKLTAQLGNRFMVLDVATVDIIYAADKCVYAVSDSVNRPLLIDHTLEELESSLNPSNFFRINRKYLVNIDAIVEVKKYFNRRLKLVTRGSFPNDLVVSRNKVNEFKTWINQ